MSIQEETLGGKVARKAEEKKTRTLNDTLNPIWEQRFSEGLELNFLLREGV